MHRLSRRSTGRLRNPSTAQIVLIPFLSNQLRKKERFDGAKARSFACKSCANLTRVKTDKYKHATWIFNKILYIFTNVKVMIFIFLCIRISLVFLLLKERANARSRLGSSSRKLRRRLIPSGVGYYAEKGLLTGASSIAVIPEVYQASHSISATTKGAYAIKKQGIFRSSHTKVFPWLLQRNNFALPLHPPLLAFPSSPYFQRSGP